MVGTFLPLTTFCATFCSGDILCGGGGRQQVFIFYFFWLLVIESEGVLMQYGKQRERERERAVRGDSSFFFRVLQKEPVGGGEVCLRVGDSDFFEEPWREKKKKRKETSRRGARRRKEGWLVFEED